MLSHYVWNYWENHCNRKTLTNNTPHIEPSAAHIIGLEAAETSDFWAVSRKYFLLKTIFSKSRQFSTIEMSCQSAMKNYQERNAKWSFNLVIIQLLFRLPYVTEAAVNLTLVRVRDYFSLSRIAYTPLSYIITCSAVRIRLDSPAEYRCAGTD